MRKWRRGRSMNKKDKRIIAVCVLVLVFLIVNFVTALETFVGYNRSKASGNERWRQVEERIVRIETDVESLKQEVQEWKS